MAKKNSIPQGGIVFSTDPNFSFKGEDKELVTLPAHQQQLKVRLDTRQRAGKVVTLVEGFQGKQIDLDALGKELKTRCGSGGTVKDGLILIQGSYLERIRELLKQKGFKIK
ncbi:MAG: translation initiation factor [Chitinophagaceae bacterium]